MNYDLSKLNDREFESLGASIVEKILNTKVEKFKAGKDGGVDGRFWIDNNKEGIIQCKHYVETPYKQLVAKLKSVETNKVRNLKPSRYIFITSKKLSRENKQEIKNIFAPFILHQKDIMSGEDIQSFLAKKENLNIVEQHFKLWMTSAFVLDLINNNAITGRSKSTLEDIKERTLKYIVTDNHLKGIRLLEAKNVLILTGDPGIGKTTLADALSLQYIAKGYEFCDIEENISEAENINREIENKRILFYCDDFLGSNLYDAINNKRDSHIVKFINRIAKDKTKKFILTSRTNILNKASSQSHVFQNGKIRDNEFLLKVENLTEIDKAKILYNHIYHSNLSKEHIDEIYAGKKYKLIISHRNYNPRIIEFITDSIRVGNILPADYWDYIYRSLENPEDIWSDYFQHQTDDCVRALIFLTVYNKGKISEDHLRESYNKFLKMHLVNLGDHTDKSFESVRKLAFKSLLNRNQIEESKYEYSLFNPSIADYILNSYAKEYELISNVFKSLNSTESIRYFHSQTIAKKISVANSKKIHYSLFDHFFENKMLEQDWDFLILLSYIDFFNDKFIERIEIFLKTLVRTDYTTGSNLWELLMLLQEFDPKINITNYKFLHGFIDDLDNEDDIQRLLNFIDENNIDDEYILEKVNTAIEQILYDMVYNNDLDIDYNKHLKHNYHPDGDIDLEIDIDGLTSEVRSIFDSYLNNFNETGLQQIGFDVSNALSNAPIEDLAQNYLENLGYYDDEYRPSHNGTSGTDDDIDAIFER